MILGFLKKLFRSKAEKDMAELRPIVDLINQEYVKLRALSDDELRNKTSEFKQFIQQKTINQRNKVQELTVLSQNEKDIAKKEELYNSLDAAKKELNKAIEEVLKELLPKAFAVVKETARRLTENQQLVVTATEWDKKIAQKKSNVVIEGDKAIWKNRWTAAGSEVEWNMIHYDVQLIGGTVLHQGKIAEMATGEGKTLVATLPVYLNALAGMGVHVVTVNDYLARRDAEWNGPLFEFHQLSVDCIDLHEPNSDARKNAYLADITYGTNNEFGFDYLRDNMVTHPEHLVQRDLHYAIIDEVDSILIDEARTPLIIAGPVPQGDKHEFDILKPRIEKLVQLQKEVVNENLAQAKKILANGLENLKEADKLKAGTYIYRAHKGLPKHKALLKFLQNEQHKLLMQKAENYHLEDNAKKMHLVDDELYFIINEKNNQIELTDKGIDALTLKEEDPNLFVLPDLGHELSKIDNHPDLNDEQKLHAKEKLIKDFSDKSERLHSIHQLLKAYTLFERDVHYIVQEGKVMIVDENTGRVLPGRRWSDGLHQAVESKENVKIEAATQTYATITLQNFFRMYHKLAGMTGTAETEAKEFYEIYKLDVVTIPTNKPVIRKDLDDKVYKTKREKYNAIIEEVADLISKGRPVLIGTTSVETSETLSRLFKQRGIAHELLNAKHHQREAEIVAKAGQAGAVTIATNMAGRGTDIKLGPGVKEAGGLAIIGSERHESRRIDRQLRGRAGRQGDPGSSQFFVSLEDDLMRLFGSERIAKAMTMLNMKEGEVIQSPWITSSITKAQQKVEENNFAMRKRLLEYDDVMNYQRDNIYRKRRNALFGDRIKIDLEYMRAQLCESLVKRYYDVGDVDSLNLEVLQIFSIDFKLKPEDLDRNSAEKIIQNLYQLVTQKYHDKTQRLAQDVYQAAKQFYDHIQVQKQHDAQFLEMLPQIAMEIHLTDGSKTARLMIPIGQIIDTQGSIVIDSFEKTVVLGVIDEAYKDHLRNMDDLRQSVQNAVFEQKDPLLVYKLEASALFQNLLTHINMQVLSFLLKAEPVNPEPKQTQTITQPKRDDFSKLKTQHEERSIGVDETDIDEYEGVLAGVNRPDPYANLSRRERRELERKNKKKK
jgi:preprotein translocase subunit SecA